MTFLGLFLLMIPTGCKKTESREFSRFIDILNLENVTSSPMLNLEEQFTSFVQKWPGEKMYRVWVTGEGSFWGFKTRHPVLEGEKGIPFQMVLRKDGIEIPFYENIAEVEIGWTWRNLDRFIGAHDWDEKINLGDEYSEEVFFPGGDVLIELKVENGHPNKLIPHLQFSIDDNAVCDLQVGGNSLYRAYRFVPPGFKTWKVRYDKAGRLQPFQGDSSLAFSYLHIKSLSSVVLFNQESDANPQGLFESEYIIEPWYHFEKWDEASLGQGEAIERRLVLDPGYHFIEINYDAPLDATGYFQMTINSTTLGLCKIYPGINAVYSWEVNTKVRRSHLLKLEMINEKDKDGNEVPVKPVKITNLITYGSQDELFKHLLQTRLRSRLLDSGIGEDPLGIKNKISVEEDTLNVLLAPPYSEFTFDVLVPEDAALQFGCGLSSQARDLNGDGVEFAIVLQDELGDKDELFRRVLDPFHNQDQDLREEKIIDLSGYSGQNVVFRFITSTPDQLNFQNDISYWINPLIYQRSGRPSLRNGKPNVLLISLDTLRADHLSCYGYERKTSPYIDLLVKDGILFDRCFSHASYTLPSHVSMLTGLNPVKHKVFSSVMHSLDPSMITLADRLREKGYLTAAVTGGGIMGSFYGFPKGFDSYNERLTRIQGTTAQKIGELAVSWLEKNGDKPFFLFLHTYQIHGPFLPPPPYKASFLEPEQVDINSRKLNDLIGDAYRNYFIPLTDQQRKNLVALYDAEILYTDEVMLEPVFKSLKDQDLYDNTMIIVTSDHGEEFYDHGGWLHGHTLYNELINVPLIIKFPHNRFSGKTFENIVRSIDILPTILQELGIGLVQSEIDGKSLIKIIQKKENEDRVFFSEIKYASIFPDQIASNSGDFKMLLNKSYTDAHYNYFSTPPPSRKDIELYDLLTDFEEKNNIARQKNSEVSKIMESIARYLQQGEYTTEDGRKIKLDERVKEQLRALGYLK